MKADFFAELATGSAEVLVRAMNYGNPEYDLDPMEIDVLVAYSRQIANLMKAFRDKSVAALDRGVEAGKFKSACGKVFSHLPRYMRMLSNAVQYLEQQPRSTERSVCLASLWDDQRTLLEIQTAVSDWLAFLDRPRRPIDVQKLEAEVKEDREAGRLVTLESFEDLLRKASGGE